MFGAGFPLEGIIFSAIVGCWCGVVSTVFNDESRQLGAMGYQQHRCGRMDARRAVELSGGVDGRPDKVYASITLVDGFVKDGGSDFFGVCIGAR
jgi:hypothetical protein